MILLKEKSLQKTCVQRIGNPATHKRRIGFFILLQFVMMFLSGLFALLPATAALGQVQNRFDEHHTRLTASGLVFLETEATPVNPIPTQTPDSYYSSYFANSWEMPEIVGKSGNFWIKVNLSDQILYAYRGDRLIKVFYVSTGTKSFQTVTGTYRVYAKYNQYDMRGPGYDLYDVPYVLFFHKGYSIHGTYWHDNFGTPMSRGCVNMKTEDAAWIYENAPVGTYVFIHS